MLFKLLTNEPAFEGGSTPELCVAILVGSPRDLRKLRPDVPDELIDVVLKCLHKEPSRRYASVTDLARALVTFAPPHSASSVDRIARVGSSADLHNMNSEPPRSVHGAKSASGGPSTASTVGEGDALASGGTVDIPMHVEMHTLTSSAASLSSDGAAAAKELATPKRRSARRVSIAIGAAVAIVAIIAGVRVATRSGDETRAVGLTAAPPPSPSIAPPPPSEPDPGASAAPVTAPTAAHPAAPPSSSAPSAAPPAVGDATPPRVPGARTTQPPSAPIPSAPRTAAAATTAAAVPAAAAPPPHAAGTSSADFGGRK